MSIWRRVSDHFIPHIGNAYRPHLLRRGWMVFFLALVLATEGFLVASLVARQSGSSFLAAIVQSQLISMTNAERAHNNVGQLAENKFLDAAAQAKANDMARDGYFAHQSPDGRQPWDFITAAGYDYEYAGENLAVRFIDSQDVVNAWMASPSHRANIVKPQYTDIGVGVAQGTYKGADATFVVQYFGAPTAAFLAQESAQGRVLGAAVGPGAGNPLNSALRQLPRLLSDPQHSTAWVLSGIALLLIAVLGLTFIFHVQVQPTDLMLPGVAVVGIALFLLAFNSLTLSSAAQPAAAALGQPTGVVLPAEAAVTP